MSNSNNVISFALDDDECWVIDESAPSSACVPRLKKYLLIGGVVRAKESIMIEHGIEGEHGVIASMSKSTAETMILPCLGKRLMASHDVLGACESKASGSR